MSQAPGERSRARKTVIAAALPLGLLAAVIGQLTVVNRLPLPGGDAPDLVLVLVTAVAVRATPLTGALTGFAGGLALDVAPPQTHYAGEYALVFCLAGYLAARVAALADGGAGGAGSVMAPLSVMAAAAAAGEAGKAALGLLLLDPNVTGAAIRHVLPGAVGYDLLLSPVALGLVALVAGRPAAITSVPRPEFAAAWRLAAAFRLASAGAAPDLRLAGSGPVHRRPSRPRREPRLRLSGARAHPFARTDRAGSPSALPLLAGGRASKLHFTSYGRSGPDRLSSRGGAAAPYASPRSPSRGWLRRDQAAFLAPVRRRTPSRGWLRSSGRSPARPGWPARSPSGKWLRRGRRPWHRRSHGNYLKPGAVPYTSRSYPTRTRSYSRRLLALVGGRR